MADIIEMAREIGRQLQKDELYLKLELAKRAERGRRRTSECYWRI